MMKSIAKHPYVPRQANHKNVAVDKKTFTSSLPCFEGRKDGDSTSTVCEILSIERDSGATSTTTS